MQTSLKHCKVIMLQTEASFLFLRVKASNTGVCIHRTLKNSEMLLRGHKVGKQHTFVIGNLHLEIKIEFQGMYISSRTLQDPSSEACL